MPWSCWSINCWRESPSRRPLDFLGDEPYASMAPKARGDVVIDASNINAVSIFRKTTSIEGETPSLGQQETEQGGTR